MILAGGIFLCATRPPSKAIRGLRAIVSSGGGACRALFRFSYSHPPAVQRGEQSDAAVRRLSKSSDASKVGLSLR